MRYVELHCKSNFSFLEGASHADELLQRAGDMGYEGLAITDRNTLAGSVRGHSAARDQSIAYYVGAEIHPVDGPPIVIWPQDRAGYGRLSRLITRGRLRREKGGCQITWQDICELNQGCLAGLLLRQPVPESVPESDQLHHADTDAFPWEAGNSPTTGDSASDTVQLDVPEALLGSASSQILGESEVLGGRAVGLPNAEFDPGSDGEWLKWLGLFREVFADRAYLLTQTNMGVSDESKLLRHAALAKQAKVPLLASGDVHFHAAERSILHDCLLATRLNTTIDDVVSQRLGNSEYHLRSLRRLQASFAGYTDALERTVEVASRLDFSLDHLRYQYPEELSEDGQSPIDFLKRISWEGAKRRYPDGVPEQVIDALRHELRLIEKLHYEAYFLTVWDLVRFARSRGILCQGRGSAANSAVCYCLGVTSVDPSRVDLLFERFISEERNEAPDIDVDFEHQRREEVLQYIYEKYGRHRAAMTATVTTYRSRSAIRDVGRALGVSLDQIDSLSKLVDARIVEGNLTDRMGQCGLDPESPIGQRFRYLVENLVGFPRHLSQHVGGMVMTQDWLCEVCPLENAAMEGRTVIQWDKDDLDELGILKVDCLSLGMLSAIHRSFDMIQLHYDRGLTLATVPAEDPDVYDMICAADTVGVFQIESRAQMSMLPRLRPRSFYDLVIEVAIVRPGPIQGQMVHPYLTARRTGVQPEYPSEAIREVLAKTMGVPIFQEQAMRLAVVAAGFTPGEADQLRRAMAAWRRPGLIDQFHKKLIGGMKQNGLSEEFAERVYTQIRGFGEYGFPESHAASFALLVYVSCWLKHHYPAVFCASIINSQPMGFYAPAQLVTDAREHGVRVRPVDVNCSFWDCTLEPSSTRPESTRPNSTQQSADHELRLGMRMIRGLPEQAAIRVTAARSEGGPYRDLVDFTRRTQLGSGVVTQLADAGALQSITGDRRSAYWQSLSQEQSDNDHSLFAAAGVDCDETLPDAIAPMHLIEEVYTDYSTIGLSLRAHPISFVRGQLDAQRVTRARDLKQTRDGKFVRVGGLVILRQRPSTAKGITFVTLEDETGSMNLVITPEVWKRHFRVARTSNAWLVHGACENREGIIHVVVGRIEDLTESVEGLVLRSRDFH